MTDNYGHLSETNQTTYDPVNTAELLNYLNIQTDYRDLLTSLTGLSYNSESEEWERVGKALIEHPAGIDWVVRTLKPYFSTSSTVNNFSADNLKNHMYRLGMYLADHLEVEANCDILGIRDEHIDEVINTIETYADFNINRSFAGGELNAITSSLKTIQSVSEKMSPTIQKKGRLGFLNPFNK